MTTVRTFPFQRFLLLMRSAGTWFRFLVKQTFTKHPPGTKDYTWYKFNVFTRWVAATRQTIAIIFDPRPQIKDRLPEFLFQAYPKSGAADPFELHRYFLEELADLQDKAVWGIRDLVRNTEINRNMPSEARKVDNYFGLHEVGRHAIHVTETLTVAIDTVDAMMKNHEQYILDYPTTDTDVKTARSQTRMHLAFFDNAFRSLLSRSDSNKSRLSNEIQLSYNVLTLYESQISIEIGRSAQIDSRAMKTVSFLTMSFLPATFISAIFSMSFFDFDAQSETFTISKSFWMYWAVTVPVTILSVLLWWHWETLFPIKLIGEGENAPQRLIHRSTEMELAEQELKKPSSVVTRGKDNSDKV